MAAAGARHPAVRGAAFGGGRLDGLAGVLDEVYCSSVPLAEKRRLAARVAACSLPMARQPQWDAPAMNMRPIEQLEELLAGSHGRVNVIEAKAALRAQGERGKQLASRLGRASKARNCCAHQD